MQYDRCVSFLIFFKKYQSHTKHNEETIIDTQLSSKELFIELFSFYEYYSQIDTPGIINDD